MSISQIAQKVTVEVVRKAIMGADIRNNPQLLVSCGGRVPQDCIEAAQILMDNYSEFEDLLWQRLTNFPLTKHFCSHLIRSRLKQKGILAFPIISIVFDDNSLFEQRLNDIKAIPGVKSLRKEYRGSNDPAITDQTTLDLLAEILVLDFLLKLDFLDITKVSANDGKSHPDVLAHKDGENYAIEVTRKQEIEGWETLEYGNLEDCTAPKNHEKIRGLLLKALIVKNQQFSRAISANTLDKSAVKVVAIKTSDFGFAWCIDQAAEIANALLSEDNWEYVDCIWLVPNIAFTDSRWICKKAAG